MPCFVCALLGDWTRTARGVTNLVWSDEFDGARIDLHNPDPPAEMLVDFIRVYAQCHLTLNGFLPSLGDFSIVPA